jgi:hypothetical protein
MQGTVHRGRQKQTKAVPPAAAQCQPHPPAAPLYLPRCTIRDGFPEEEAASFPPLYADPFLASPSGLVTLNLAGLPGEPVPKSSSAEP